MYAFPGVSAGLGGRFADRRRFVRGDIMVAIGPLAVGQLSAHRTCRHLAPLERLLAAAGAAVGPGQPCPHDADWGTWFTTAAALDARVLRRHMALDPCVSDIVYEGVFAAGDVTFYCAACKRAIVGRLPRTGAAGGC